MNNLLYTTILILLLAIFFCLLASHLKINKDHYSIRNKLIDKKDKKHQEVDCGKYTQTTNNIHWKLYDKYNLPKCIQSFPDLREMCFT